MVLLGIGFFAGWIYGYARPMLKIEREFAKNAEMTPDEIRELMQKYRDIADSITEEDRLRCYHSLRTLMLLEDNDLKSIESDALKEVTRYYYKYKPEDLSEDQQKVMTRIEKVSEAIPALLESINIEKAEHGP